MVTMLGWLSRAQAWASRKKRARSSGVTSRRERTLRATARSRIGSRALKIVPMPPRPIRSITSYLPIRWIMLTATLARSRREQMHGRYGRQGQTVEGSLLGLRQPQGLAQGQALCQQAIRRNRTRFLANPALQLRGTRRRRADTITRADRQRAIRPMSQAELSAVLAAAEQDARHYPLFLLLARTGLRPGEAFALQLGDLDSARASCAWSAPGVRGGSRRPRPGGREGWT